MFPNDDYNDYDNRCESSLEREIEQYNNERDRDGDSNNNEGARPGGAPPKPGEKRRRNAKAPVVKCSIYAHEKATFAQTLEAAIEAVGRDHRTLQFKIVADNLRTSQFTAIYSIPGGSTLKNMQLTTNKEYEELVEEALTKGKPEAKLEITETESESTAVTGDLDDDEAASRKAKKCNLTADEEEMADTVVQLQQAHHCSDRLCSFRTCFAGNPTATHICLTPLHLATWAAAILVKAPGVDIKNPPGPNDEKMFWPVEGSHSNTDDITLLASCRLAAANKSSDSSSSSVTITNDFSGFATLLQPFLAQTASHPPVATAPSPVTPSRHAPVSASPIKPAKMTIHEFCVAFQLDADIEGLAPIKLAGPHHLSFLKNEILDNYLQIGQWVAVRYAEGEWKKGLLGL